MRFFGPAVLVLILFACKEERAAIVRMRDNTPVGAYTLASVSGIRNGDQFQATAVFVDGESLLTMRMRFLVGVPTKLTAGEYSWRQNGRTLTGKISARSVTFLGGQSGPPGIGGVFELHAADGAPLFKVRVPTTEAKRQP